MKINYTYGNLTRKVVVVFGAILYVTLAVIVAAIGRSGQGTSAQFLGASIQGVLTALELLIALVMVAVEYYLGGILALICVAFSMYMATMNIVMTHTFSSMPGLMSNIASIIAIITIRKRLRIEHMRTLTDELTGISNRKHIVQYIDHLASIKKSFVVLFFEIDNIKLINDLYGFSKGDEIIKQLVDEWKKIRPADVAFGRFSGTEFIAVINKNKCENVDELANEYFEATRLVAERSVTLRDTLSISMGVVKCPLHDNKPSQLLAKADIAAREAHKRGKNIWMAYQVEFEDELYRKQYIEARIKRALSDNKFYMVYQPQFTANDKKVRGFESLIRMDAGGQEQLYPGDFIPVAEKSDLIIDIGEYVLRCVCKDFSPIIKKYPDILVSVNVSAKQLLSQDFVSVVERTLYEMDFNPKNLEIEITEYCVMDTADEAIKVVNTLKEMGIKFAMDDFGTGYSSLSYMSRLPIDLLKIDKSLVDDIKDGEIVQAIISMAHALNCEVIAEGVEEQYQLDILKDRGCDLIQGFIWSKPVAYDEAISLL